MLSNSLFQGKELAESLLQHHVLPTRKDDLWRYSGFSREFDVPSPTLSSETNSVITSLPTTLIPNQYQLCFYNGCYHQGNSVVSDTLGNDILHFSAANLSEEQQKKYLPYYDNNPTEEKHNFFSLWNIAKWEDGLILHVPTGYHAKEIVYLSFLTAVLSENSCAMRNTIILDENSSLVIVEDHVSLSSARYFKNISTKIILKRGAKLKRYVVSRESQNTSCLLSTDVELEGETNLQSYDLFLGNPILRNEIQVSMLQPNANCELYGLYQGYENQQIDHAIEVHHKCRNTSSLQCYRGILHDEASGAFTGKVYIHKDASGCRASQTHKAILLSDAAKSYARPQLEIYNDDVVCSHNATTGYLDPDSLFYLLSRGLNLDAAKKILVSAFSDFILSCIDNELIYKQIYLLFNSPEVAND